MESLKKLINEPEYYFRKYENDIGGKAARPATSDICKRIAFAAAPFLAFYNKPFNSLLSVGFGALRISTSAVLLYKKGIQKKDAKETFKLSFQLFFASLSLTGTLFSHPVGLLLITGQDLAIECGNFKKHFRAKKYEKIAENGLDIINSLFYLSLFFSRRLELLIASISLQVLLSTYRSQSKFRKGKWIEGAGHLLMGVVRSQELKRHYRILQVTKQFEKLFAVHATERLPAEGVLYAGFGGQRFEQKLGEALYPDSRMTVHFALGELVRPVGDNWVSWEDSPYAVVTSLESLFPQIINLNCYDTFILGNFTMGEGSTLILPEGELSKLPKDHHYAVWTYDPSMGKIRDVVDKVIASKNGWSVRMHSNDMEETLAAAYLQGTGININTQDFFKPIKELFPYIGIGLRFEKLDGEGHLFSKLESAALESAETLLDPTFGNDDVRYANTAKNRRTLQKTLQKIDSFINTSSFSPLAKQNYQDKKTKLLNWINILDAELDLNKSCQKTLRGASADIWEKVAELRDDKEGLQQFLESVSDSLPGHSYF